MPDDTQGERLLETARDVLREQLLPALPPQQRHAALMVANAMAIAARELDRRTDPAADAARAAADSQLCASIRTGQFDGGAAAAQVHARLLADTRARVEVSNPRFLMQRALP
jgi:urease accessory protein UreF